MEINQEEEYIKRFPVINDIVLGYINQFGIDISKYYFCYATKWDDDVDGMDFYDVGYCSKVNENITLMVCISFNGDQINLEQFCLSLD